MVQNFIQSPFSNIHVIESLVFNGLPEMGFLKSLRTNRRFKGFVEKNSNVADVFYIKSYSDQVLFPLDGFYGQNMTALFSGDSSNSSVDVAGFDVYAIDARRKGLVDVAARSHKTIWEVGDNLTDRFAKDVAENQGKVAIVDSFNKGESSLCSIYYPSFNNGCFNYVASREQGKENFERCISFFLKEIYKIECGREL